jgi:hypothetical protein
MDQLDSRDGAHGVLELLESQHRPQARLDVPVILLDDVVEILEILARSDPDAPDGPQLSVLSTKLANAPIGSLVSVKRDRARPPSLCREGFAEKTLAAARSRFGLKRKSTV